MSKKTKQTQTNPTIIVAVIAATATILTAVIALLMPFAERLANPESTATPEITLHLTQSAYPILFQDDFSTGLGPDDWKFETSFGRVFDGIYRMGVTKPNIVTWRTYDGIDVADIYLKVDISMPASTNLYSCGIILRQSENGHYYYGINNEQEYEFIKYSDKNGEDSDIALIDWLGNIAINTRGINELEIIAKQNVFELYVNGVYLNTVTDDAHSKGEFGFYVSTYGGGNEVVVEFDNLLVEER